MTSIGRTLMVLGALLFAAGALISLGDRLPFRLGRLPGDFSWQVRNWSVHLPLATSLLLSLLATLALWLWNRK
jgi:hypothetical protein